MTLGALWSAIAKNDPIDRYTAKEQRWFDTSPNRFRDYRGCDASRSGGLSWSTNRAIALDFAHEASQMSIEDFEILAAFGAIEEKRIAPFIYYGAALHSI